MRHHPRCEFLRASSVLLFGVRSSQKRGARRAPKRSSSSFVLSNEREQSAVKRTRDACSCKEQATDPAGPASPYGAPLRRLTNLGAPLALLAPLAFAAGDGRGKERALGVCLTPGGTSKAARDHGVRTTTAGAAPRSHSARLQSIPAANGDAGCLYL
jgi:hypothetical protein